VIQGKILYISYDGMTDPLGESQVIPYLEGLSKKGHLISIISFEKKNRFAIHSDRIKKILAKSHIDWHPLFYTKNPPVLSTIYDLFRLRKKASQLQKKNSFDIVHCRSYLSSLVGLFLKRKYHLRFIFDMRGFWADERVEGNLWKLSNPFYRLIYRFFKRKEIRFLTKADAIVSLTQNAATEIASWKNVPIKSSITVIPCCVDTHLFNKEKIDFTRQEAIRTKLGINPDEKIVLYLGSIGTWYLVKEMLLFFNTFHQSYPTSKFLFITTESKEIIYQEAKQLNVPTDYIIVKESIREELPYYISLTQFAIFFIKSSYSKKASSPTKQAEILSMGIPIICNKNIGDTDYIISENNCGIAISDLSESSFVETIRKIDNLLILDKNKIRQTALDYFSLEKGIEKYNEIYRFLLKRN